MTFSSLSVVLAQADRQAVSVAPLRARLDEVSHRLAFCWNLPEPSQPALLNLNPSL